MVCGVIGDCYPCYTENLPGADRLLMVGRRPGKESLSSCGSQQTGPQTVTCRGFDSFQYNVECHYNFWLGVRRLFVN